MMIRDLLTRHDRLTHHSGTRQLSSVASAGTGSQRNEALDIALSNSPVEISTTPPAVGQEAPLLDVTDMPSSIPNNPHQTPTSIANESHSTVNCATQNSSFAIEYDSLQYFTANYMDDFSSFMDSVCDPSHTFSPSYQLVPWFFEEPDISVAAHHKESVTSLRNERPAPSRTSDPIVLATSNPTTFESQVPRLQPEEDVAESISEDQKDPHLHVSEGCRQRIVNDLAGLSTFIDKDFVLPSRHALSRFFGGYFTSFHNHFPFLHIPTLRPNSITVELFLAITAVGARYTCEPEISANLFRAAKAIVFEQIRKQKAARVIHNPENAYRQRAAPNLKASHAPTHQEHSPRKDEGPHTVELIETMLLMVAITTWSEPRSSFDGLSMRSMLDCLIREEKVLVAGQPQLETADGRQSWIRLEQRKRIIFVAFCFINMHTVIFDIPPAMWANQIHIDLSCCEREWRAGDEEE